MSAVATPEAIGERFAAQREHLNGLLTDTLEQLRAMADRRKALAYDVVRGGSGEHELEVLERQQGDATTKADRLRDSLAELDKREGIELRAAEQARLAALRKDLNKQVAATGKLRSAVADAAEAFAKAVLAAQLAEDLEASLAAQLDLRLDSFDVLALATAAIYENGVTLRGLNLLERGEIVRAKNNRDDGMLPPMAQLRRPREILGQALRVRQAS